MGRSSSHEYAQDVWPFELPAGGVLHLRSDEELEYAENIRDRYIEDYGLNKTNDLVLVGALVSNQLELYRAQQEQNGMEPAVDAEGIPTGDYKMVQMKASDKQAALTRLAKATEQVRAIEQSLGIDKKARESGGAYTVEERIGALKKAARTYGLHISRRFKLHEKFVNNLRWRIRLLRNGAAEDRRYHGVESPEKVLEWAEEELRKVEDADKKFANERGRLVIGRI